MKTIKEQYPQLHKEAVKMSNDILRSINDKACRLTGENVPYKAQCLLETIIQELEKAV